MLINKNELQQATAGNTLIALLQACHHVGWLSLALLLHAALMLYVGTGWELSLFSLSLLAGLASQYFCIRLTLDADLFRELYRPGAEPQLLDRSLTELLTGHAKALPPRSLASRWLGTQRLIRGFGAVLTMQLLLWLAALLIGAIN